MNAEELVGFVKDQIRRVDRWCWETIVEEVAAHKQITLNPDNVTYAAGSLRTGPYLFRRNNQSWRSLCDRIVNDDEEASKLIDEVVKALESEKAKDVAATWRSTIQIAIETSLSPHRGIAEDVLRWDGLRYTDSKDYSPQLSVEVGIVYGLWRLGGDGKPLMLSPLYIGEAADNMLSRMHRPKNKCHQDWWGDGKPIGVSLSKVDPDHRKEIEGYLISVLLPFCNVSKSQFLARWHFPQP